MKQFSAVASVVILSVFLIGPAFAGPDEESSPIDQQQLPVEQELSSEQESTAEKQPPALQVLPVTPQALVNWHNMEAARRANRDSAAAMRQQLIRQSGENLAPLPTENLRQ